MGEGKSAQPSGSMQYMEVKKTSEGGLHIKIPKALLASAVAFVSAVVVGSGFVTKGGAYPEGVAPKDVLRTVEEVKADLKTMHDNVNGHIAAPHVDPVVVEEIKHQQIVDGVEWRHMQGDIKEILEVLKSKD